MSTVSTVVLGVAAGAAAALLLTACSGRGSVVCESNQRYANSRTSPPWRIPDDLSAPKRTDALQIPAVPGQNGGNAEPSGSAQTPCLETPPSSLQQGRQNGAAQPPPARKRQPSNGDSDEGPSAGP